MSGLRLGRIFGVDVHIHASWLFIAALVLWTLTATALPADFPDIGAGARVGMAVLITLLFFASLLAHELAHSLVAMARGIPVHRITFFLFGGMAQTSTDSRSAGEEFMIAIAGPLMSFLLAALFFALWYLGLQGGWTPVLVGSFAYISALNVILGAFNLLPGFPMDGGRVLRSAIWKATGSVTRATRWASRVGQGMAWLLILYGFWQLFRGDTIGGIWIIFIGWFIRHAARTSYRQHLMARMQAMAQSTFEQHYHRHPFGTGPGSASRPEAGPRREHDRPGSGPETGGRDVSHLGDTR